MDVIDMHPCRELLLDPGQCRRSTDIRGWVTEHEISCGAETFMVGILAAELPNAGPMGSQRVSRAS